MDFQFHERVEARLRCKPVGMFSPRMVLAVALSLLAFLVAGCGEKTVAAGDDGEVGPTDSSEPTKKVDPADDPAAISAEAQNAALVKFAAKHRPVFCGGRAKPWVAFTFDDGPGPYTKKMLKILGSQDLPATFFLVGRNVATYRSSLKAELKYGTPIGNHSWSHPLLTELSSGEQEQQLVDTNDAIEGAGAPKVQLFRPPYGAHDKATDRIARNEGMVQVLWNIDSEDALGASSKKISRKVKRGLRPGSIILLHENRGQTIRAMKFTILPHLKRQNMQLVTVPQMLAGNPPSDAQMAKGRKGCR